MKISIDTNRKCYAILLEALGTYCDRHNEFTDVFFQAPGEFDATLIINGHELDLGDCIELMERAFDDATKQAAKELLEEKYIQCGDRLADLSRGVQSFCEQTIREFGLESDYE